MNVTLEYIKGLHVSYKEMDEDDPSSYYDMDYIIGDERTDEEIYGVLEKYDCEEYEVPYIVRDIIELWSSGELCDIEIKDKDGNIIEEE